MRYDVVVVGAGPAGSRTAAQLSRGGFSVLLLEEHAAPGLPVHCTGIVGEACMAEFDLPRSLVSAPLPHFNVHAPHGNTFRLTPRRSIVYLDRRALDQHLADVAVQHGAVLQTSARVRSVTNLPHGVRIEATVGGEAACYEARSAVLACGTMSDLPRRSGIPEPSLYYRTVQAEVACDGRVGADVYLGSQFSQGSFAWAAAAAPGRIKTGIIAAHHARDGYRHLMARLDATAPRLCRERHRRMPLGLVRRSTVGRIAAVGDAAGQIKTTTGGGIYYAMVCADILAEALRDAWSGGRIDSSRLAAYHGRWKLRIGSDIAAGVLARQVFEQIEDLEVDRLVALCGRPEVEEIIGRHFDFDFHRGLLLALMVVPAFRRLVSELTLRGGRWQRLLRHLVTVGTREGIPGVT